MVISARNIYNQNGYKTSVYQPSFISDTCQLHYQCHHRYHRKR